MEVAKAKEKAKQKAIGFFKTLSFIGTICYYIGLAILFVLYFPLFLISYIFITPFDKRRYVTHQISRLFCVLIIKICPFWRFKIEGKEKIDPNQTYIIAPNHQSMMDIPLIGSVIPMIYRYVSKREVSKVPIIGLVLPIRGDILIDRGGAASAKMMLKKAKGLVAQKISIVIFPEGTRSKTGRVAKFKEGAFIVAKSTSTPILPVVIDGTWEVSNYFGGMLKMPTRFRVTVLDPIGADVVKSKSLSELAEYTHDIILGAHKEIEPSVYNNI